LALPVACVMTPQSPVSGGRLLLPTKLTSAPKSQAGSFRAAPLLARMFHQVLLEPAGGVGRRGRSAQLVPARPAWPFGLLQAKQARQ
jgi:hypothetical protein